MVEHRIDYSSLYIIYYTVISVVVDGRTKSSHLVSEGHCSLVSTVQYSSTEYSEYWMEYTKRGKGTDKCWSGIAFILLWTVATETGAINFVRVRTVL